MTQNSNGWNEWSRHVLAELERLNKTYEQVNTNLQNFQIKVIKEITALKVKSSIWGAVGGVVSVMLIVAMQYLKKITL